MAWTGNWADDEDDGDLGIPPPSSTVSPPLSERRSYVAVALEILPEPLLRIVAVNPNPAPVHRRTMSPPRQFAKKLHQPARNHHRKPEVVIIPQQAAVEKESKCGNGDCKQRGYLKFTERHVEAQPKEGQHRLRVGVYCQECVTAAAPRCAKAECSGKAIICLPDAVYPFGLFCGACITAHRAGLRS